MLYPPQQTLGTAARLCPKRGMLVGGMGESSPQPPARQGEEAARGLPPPLSGLESLVGQGDFLSSSLSSHSGVGDGLGVGERPEPSPSPGGTTKLCTGEVWGGTAVPCTPLPAAVGRPGSLRRGGGSPQPPDHCDTRAGICRHGGDWGGVARPEPSPWDPRIPMQPRELLPIPKLVLTGPDLKSRGKLRPALACWR